jgi:hypothetical protein
MTSRTRETLKNFFKDGQRPSQENFSDLIDSMLNMSDDGYRVTVENGQELSSSVGHDALISFFRNETPQAPKWTLGFSRDKDQLVVQGAAAASDADPGPAEGAAPSTPLLTLDASQRIGVRQPKPQAELDIVGSLRCQTREGSYPGPVALADGGWHDITPPLGGCQAFEVVAGVAHRGIGRVAMVHAIALNTFNPSLGILNFLNRKRGIRSTHAYYSRRVDRIHLRWNGTSGKNALYTLQAKTGSNYGPNIAIEAQLTRLWTRSDMTQVP